MVYQVSKTKNGMYLVFFAKEKTTGILASASRKELEEMVEKMLPLPYALAIIKEIEEV